MQLKISVVPVQDHSSNLIGAPKLHKGLPKAPFFAAMVAPRGSGKTNLLLNLICRGDMYNFYFEKIRVWSPSIYTDKNWTSPWVKSQLNSKYVYDEFNESFVMDLFNRKFKKAKKLQLGDEDMKGKRMKRELWVFDDMITEQVSSNAYYNVLAKLALRGRHPNISVIFCSQKYNAIAKKVRENTMDWIIFRSSAEEAEEMAKELRGRLTKKEWMQLYETATEQPYAFLYICRQPHIPEAEHFRRNFDTLLLYERKEEQSYSGKKRKRNLEEEEKNDS